MDYLSVEHEYIIEQEKNIDEFGNLAGGSIPFPPSEHRKTLEILKEIGLNSNSIVLDYGFGMGAFTQYIIPFLNNKSQYFGLEKSIKSYNYVLDLGMVDNNNIKYSNTNIINDYFSTIKFDFIIAFSVINHMTFNGFETLISSLNKVIHNDTKFLFTVRLTNNDDETFAVKRLYSLSDCGIYYKRFTNNNFNSSCFKKSLFMNILNKYNFKVNFLNKDIYTNKLSDLDLVIIYKNK